MQQITAFLYTKNDELLSKKHHFNKSNGRSEVVCYVQVKGVLKMELYLVDCMLYSVSFIVYEVFVQPTEYIIQSTTQENPKSQSEISKAHF